MLILDEGNGARQVVAAPDAPIRAVVVGIVDELSGRRCRPLGDPGVAIGAGRFPLPGSTGGRLARTPRRGDEPYSTSPAGRLWPSLWRPAATMTLRSIPPASTTCASLADASIDLLQDTIDIVDSMAAEDLAAMAEQRGDPARVRHHRGPGHRAQGARRRSGVHRGADVIAADRPGRRPEFRQRVRSVHHRVGEGGRRRLLRSGRSAVPGTRRDARLCIATKATCLRHPASGIWSLVRSYAHARPDRFASSALVVLRLRVRLGPATPTTSPPDSPRQQPRSRTTPCGRLAVDTARYLEWSIRGARSRPPSTRLGRRGRRATSALEQQGKDLDARFEAMRCDRGEVQTAAFSRRHRPRVGARAVSAALGRSE